MYDKQQVASPKPDQPPTPHLDAVLARAKSHEHGVAFIHQHIKEVLSRALGEPKEPESKSGLRAVRGGVLGEIESVQTEITEKINEISEMIAQLETIA